MSDDLASKLRYLRKNQELSLRALSEKSGVSQGMLSEIERGSKNPTVKLAYQIAQALGISISDLVEHDRSGPTLFQDLPSGVHRESYPNSLLHGGLEIVIYTLKGAASAGEMQPNRAGTLETVVVLDGELELRLDSKSQLIKRGESVGHGVHHTEYVNANQDQECRFLVLVDTARCP
ncbi:MAG: helix-turn-helix transcriptional regulator [Planctomycetes bacterium]|nr:helix-turn-helix transcriptional regulator [Planctomycetota bacterium]